MRLDCFLRNDTHTDFTTSVIWSSDNEIISAGDDQMIVFWNAEGEELDRNTSIEAYIVSMATIPTINNQPSDSFSIGCSDGTFKQISRNGREEKSIQAHEGAVVALAWSSDGSALLTGGEDGQVKIWSRNGNLRSTLLQLGKPIYDVCWGNRDEDVLVASSQDLILKTVHAGGRKQHQWHAHDGMILSVHWNTVTDRIVSGGEDCTFKIWDTFGRLLFTSSPFDQIVTSVAWSPNGETLAVGSYNTLSFCDKTGWTYNNLKPDSGSISSLTWSSDGTQLVGVDLSGCGVLFAQLLDRRVEWKDMEATVISPHHIQVKDLTNNSIEELSFTRDHIIELALGFDHLIVVTSSQCFIYTIRNLNTPTILDLRSPVTMIVLAPRNFLLLDIHAGPQLYGYDGRNVASPKYPSLQPRLLSKALVDLSFETLAMVDTLQPTKVHLFNLSGSAATKESKIIEHHSEILSLAFNQNTAIVQDRRLAFIDKQKDLYLCTLDAARHSTGVSRQGMHDLTSSPKSNLIKLKGNVDAIEWNSDVDSLIAIADGVLTVWFYPNLAFIDQDLLPSSTQRINVSELGKAASILSFSSSRVKLRKSDGTLEMRGVLPFPSLLFDLEARGRWEDALKLCRFVKEDVMFACLAGMALHRRQLQVAEQALAALSQIPRVLHLQRIQELPTEEARNAALALYKQNIEEAERILLQAHPPQVFRAVQMFLKLFRWEKALDLAVRQGNQEMVSIVVSKRRKWLDKMKKREGAEMFLRHGKSVTVLSDDDIRDIEERELGRSSSSERKEYSSKQREDKAKDEDEEEGGRSTTPPPSSSSSYTEEKTSFEEKEESW
jgi:intraflagellar transport protein 80